MEHDPVAFLTWLSGAEAAIKANQSQKLLALFWQGSIRSAVHSQKSLPCNTHYSHMRYTLVHRK